MPAARSRPEPLGVRRVEPSARNAKTITTTTTTITTTTKSTTVTTSTTTTAAAAAAVKAELRVWPLQQVSQGQ